MASRFEIELVLEIVENMIKTEPNHADFEYFKRLAQELHQILKEMEECEK